MADKDDKHDDNVKGKYYVDRACIACDACYTMAPENFVMDEDYDHAFVMKQPENEEEEEMCQEALEGCPVEAIGKDGGDSKAPAATTDTDTVKNEDEDQSESS